jgi:hypothetical protein
VTDLAAKNAGRLPRSKVAETAGTLCTSVTEGYSNCLIEADKTPGQMASEPDSQFFESNHDRLGESADGVDFP